MKANIVECHYWRKAYVAALKNAVPTKNAATMIINAKGSADQYMEDYKVRKDVPEFKLNRALWGNVYFALIGKVSPDKCAELADMAINDYTAFKSDAGVTLGKEEDEEEPEEDEG